jgi:hypothetical protein
MAFVTATFLSPVCVRGRLRQTSSEFRMYRGTRLDLGRTIEISVVIPVLASQVGVDPLIIGAEGMPQRDEAVVQRGIGGSEFFVARVSGLSD